MVAVVKQPLGNIHRCYTELLRFISKGQDEFMRCPAFRIRQCITGFLEFPCQIVGIERSVSTYPMHSLFTKQACINIGPQKDASIAHEG